MGRTLPSVTWSFLGEKEDFKGFKRALAPMDQRVFEELFVMARKHLAAAQYAANPLPFQTFLPAMILEMHKEVMWLRGIL